MKTLTKAVAIASLVSASALTAQVANAEMSYSAGIATTYLWRGTDLGGAAFSASADYSHDSGLYAGLWASSGDLALGNEYDVYVGFAKEFGDFSVDVQAVTYVYSSAIEESATADLTTGEVTREGVDGGAGSPGEVSDAIVSLGFKDASFSYYQSLQDEDVSYMVLGYSVAGVDLSYGMSDSDGAEYSHFDIGYGLTDELAITVSKPIDDNAGVDEDTIVVMSYTLPIE